jgi:hypothetical protein
MMAGIKLFQLSSIKLTNHLGNSVENNHLIVGKSRIVERIGIQRAHLLVTKQKAMRIDTSN